MENIGVLANLSDSVEKFKKEVERIEKAKSNIFYIFGLYWRILSLWWTSRKLLKNFRALMTLCSYLCSEALCMQKFFPDIKRIRDRQAFVYQVSLKNSRLAPLRNLLDKTLDDWDDLVEDSAIVADPEIRGLITQIADAL